MEEMSYLCIVNRERQQKTIQTIYKPFKTHNNIMAKLFYRKYQNNNPQNSGYGKWYGRVVITETVGIEYLATKMQDNCTVKRADILAVLSELGPTMSDLLKDSKRVRIPYLGCFKLGIKTTGEEDPEKFNARTNVDNVHVIFQPETKATEAGKMVKVLVEGVSVMELPNPDKKKDEDDPDDPDNGSNPDGGEDNNGGDNNDRP